MSTSESLVLDLHDEPQKVAAVIREIVNNAKTTEDAHRELRKLNLRQVVYAVDVSNHDANVWNVVILIPDQTTTEIIHCMRNPPENKTKD